MPTTKRRTASVARNPVRTRERILTAALREFAAHGFAGARMDAISRRARSNKRMLYHYFGDKAGLFQKALHKKISHRAAIADTYPKAAADRLAAWFLATCADKEWVRILCWEALQLTENRPVDGAARRRLALAHVTDIRHQQKSGEFNSKTDAAFALLAMMSLAQFPQAFPQLTRLISGRPVNDPQFQRDYAAFLKQIAAVFRPVKATK